MSQYVLLSQHALLTLDLPGASPAARKLFDAEMTKRKWEKGDVTTTWIAPFNNGVSKAIIVTETKTDVKAAATAGKLSTYRAYVSVSASEPASFKAP